jgi:hypothetical protein
VRLVTAEGRFVLLHRHAGSEAFFRAKQKECFFVSRREIRSRPSVSEDVDEANLGYNEEITMKLYFMAAMIAATILGGVATATAGGRTDTSAYGHDLSINVDQQGANKLRAALFGSGFYNMRMCGNGRRMQVLGVGAGATVDLDQCLSGGHDTLVISDPWGSRVIER